MYKICRLCPNGEQWRRPTKKYGENAKAYTSKFGFGFEEWLNREEWLLSGYKSLEGEWRYVHIQGMLTKNNAYKGQEANILFYIKETGQNPQAVGWLKNAYVIDAKEARWAAKQFTKKKWLHLMHAEVKAIGGSTKGLPPIPSNSNELTWENPLFYANIRFRPGSLELFEPRRVINPSSYYYSTALQWDGVLPTQDYVTPVVTIPRTSKTNVDDKELDRFSEELRLRRDQAGKTFLPRQAPIQNALARQLDNFFRPKKGKVTCEDGRVDIKLVAPDKSITFIEIKPASSAREAIRLAVGQLLEYSHYPTDNRADRLVIVSDAEPKADDIAYLNHLMGIYGLVVRYVHWPLGTEALPESKILEFI